MFWHAPACHLPFQASERLDSPFSPCGRRGLLTGGDVLARPCVPSPVSGIRTPRLPLLPLWEKGVGGMRGNSARECRTSLISPKHSTLESALPGCAGAPPACSSTKVRTAWVRGRPARTQRYDLLPFQASGHPTPLLPSRKKGVEGMKGKGASSAPMASPPRHTAATHSQRAE